MEYQVNVSTNVDNETTAWISEHSADGYVGELVDTFYEDGCDITDWCVFAGSRKECEDYIAKYY